MHRQGPNFVVCTHGGPGITICLFAFCRNVILSSGTNGQVLGKYTNRPRIDFLGVRRKPANARTAKIRKERFSDVREMAGF